MTDRDVELHVLYGIPCVGKSTAAIELASRRNIRTVIHTDYVREVQRRFTLPQQAPALTKVTHNAWQLHGSPTRRNIEAGFLDHVHEVAIGIHAVIGKLVSDGFAAVIEGAHFHGGLVNEVRAAHVGAAVHATLLVVNSAEELHRRIGDKERQRSGQAIEKHWHESMAVMLTLQDFLISDARAHRIRISTVEEWRKSCLPADAGCSTSTTS